MSGSNLFGKAQAVVPHSMGREVEDLRNDVKGALQPLAAIGVDEFTNPLTAAPAGLLVATAMTVAAKTVNESELLAPGKTELAKTARNLTFTTAGGTPADAPANVVITGFDGEGKAQTETVTLAQTAAAAAGVKCWSKVTKLVFAVADGAASTVSVGYGLLLGLTKKPRARAGLLAPIREIAVGVAVTTGTLNAANKSYAPAAAPEGTNDYCVYYELDLL